MHTPAILLLVRASEVKSVHHVVNHPPFVAEHGTHTNGVEATHDAMKRHLRRQFWHVESRGSFQLVVSGETASRTPQRRTHHRSCSQCTRAATQLSWLAPRSWAMCIPVVNVDPESPPQVPVTSCVTLFFQNHGRQRKFLLSKLNHLRQHSSPQPCIWHSC